MNAYLQRKLTKHFAVNLHRYGLVALNPYPICDLERDLRIVIKTTQGKSRELSGAGPWAAPSEADHVKCCRF